jgi:hypothetical protein
MIKLVRPMGLRRDIGFGLFFGADGDGACDHP